MHCELRKARVFEFIKRNRSQNPSRVSHGRPPCSKATVGAKRIINSNKMRVFETSRAGKRPDDRARKKTLENAYTTPVGQKYRAKIGTDRKAKQTLFHRSRLDTRPTTERDAGFLLWNPETVPLSSTAPVSTRGRRRSGINLLQGFCRGTQKPCSFLPRVFRSGTRKTVHIRLM